MSINGPKIVFSIGWFNITETTVIGWGLILLITLLCIWLTHNLKVVPETKRQVVAEWAVETVEGLVKSSMGSRHLNYTPYVMALFIFSAMGSLVSLFGLRSMTADVNVTMTWALITFFLIMYNKFKYCGFLGFFKSYTEPIAVMTPMNIISDIATPVSMGFRHFGNIAGGMAITSLLYMALAALSKAIHLSFSFGNFELDVAAIGIPAVLSVYFDLFTGFMQAFIFVMLTLAFVGNVMTDTQDD